MLRRTLTMGEIMIRIMRSANESPSTTVLVAWTGSARDPHEDHTARKPVQVLDPPEQRFAEGGLAGKANQGGMLDVLEGLGDVKEETGRGPTSRPAPFHEGSQPPYPMVDGAIPNAPVSNGRLLSLPHRPICPAKPATDDPDDGGVDSNGPATAIGLRDKVHQQLVKMPGSASRQHEDLD